MAIMACSSDDKGTDAELVALMLRTGVAGRPAVEVAHELLVRFGRLSRLLAAPVVDPREETDKMRGSPLTRTTSADGRFAYTLYDGAGAAPFEMWADAAGDAPVVVIVQDSAMGDILAAQRLK